MIYLDCSLKSGVILVQFAATSLNPCATFHLDPLPLMC